MKVKGLCKFVKGLSANMLKKHIGSRWSIIICGLLSSTGMIVVAVANDMYTLFVGILLLGFMLPQENVAVGAVPDYFDKYYNVAVNVYSLGSAFAIMMFAPLTLFLLEIYGWRGTMILLCGINLHTVLCGAVFQIHEDTQPSSYIKFKAESTNLEEINHSRPALQRFKTLLKESGIDMVISLPFVHRILIPGMVIGYTFSAWAIYIISYALSCGRSLKEASIVSTSGGIGIAVIRVVLPFVSSTIPYRRIMYTSSLLMTVSLIVLTLFHSVAFLCFSSLIFGIGFGMLVPLVYVAVKDVTREDQYVNAVAWFHLVDGFAMTIGATITGAIFDATKSYTIAFLTLSAVSFGTFISLGLEDMCKHFSTRKTAPI